MGRNDAMKSRKKEYKRARRRATRPWKILTWISAPITLILIILAVFCATFDNSLSIFIGGTFNNIKNKDENAIYHKMDFDSQEEMVRYGEDLCKKVEAEGAAIGRGRKGKLLFDFFRRPRLRRDRIGQYRRVQGRHAKGSAGDRGDGSQSDDLGLLSGVRRAV